ncbi:acyl-CoA thioesterase II [Fusarium austroafricanum]|uniref:Acyl-CoA thioesterase II n=1 Tax=Fusarium austroafricanum TaxID=2364996 RepID=A0A8H4KDE1_9HYPO|nr:acyl-CoA thioesterase II [Fusarium austroafricanum]
MPAVLKPNLNNLSLKLMKSNLFFSLIVVFTMSDSDLKELGAPIKPSKTSHNLQLKELEEHVFTNVYQQWKPPAARGIFGGSLIALCLSAAQRTVLGDFHIHSCHFSFLLAASLDIRVTFHVERLSDGTSFATRGIEARQENRIILSGMISFALQNSNHMQQIQHTIIMPKGLMPPDIMDGDEPEWTRVEPFERRAVKERNELGPGEKPRQRVFRHWVRYRGNIPDTDGPAAHLHALAFITDGYFILTAARVHRLWRFNFDPEDVPSLPEEVRSYVQNVCETEGLGSSVEEWAQRPRISMLASLDHNIYFHEPLKISANDWVLTEQESPWAANGRALVVQRIFAKDGTLLATCSQEGILRHLEARLFSIKYIFSSCTLQ